jgi:DEAD/DEAH box helicase domain-containing protein
VFGSHVANVLRRLRRMARIYGSDPQFLLATATIANPGELALELLGAKATVVGDDAAPRAERTVILWNPPLLDAELGLRGSALAEAAKLQAGFVERGLRTLTFAKSRSKRSRAPPRRAEKRGGDSRPPPRQPAAEQRRGIGDG